MTQGKKISGPIYIVIGTAMIFMSAFIDIHKLLFFVLAGAVFILIGFFKILIKSKEGHKKHHRHPAHHPHKPAHPQHHHKPGHPHHPAKHPSHHAAHHKHPAHKKTQHHTAHKHSAHHKTTSVAKCSSCGVKIHPLFKFCPKCGQKLK